LTKGLEDFGAYRSDVIFICLIYPLVGLALAWLIFGYQLLPLLFPLASGFALVGPIAAVGLYEMSRRREQGHRISWIDAFGVVRSPGFGAILVLGLVLVAIFQSPFYGLLSAQLHIVFIAIALAYRDACEPDPEPDPPLPGRTLGAPQGRPVLVAVAGGAGSTLTGVNGHGLNGSSGTNGHAPHGV